MLDPSLKNARILIVDDQDVNIDLLEGMLSKYGYHDYRGVTDPRQVTSVYQAWQPDLLLLDLMMPYLDGFGVMAALQPLIPTGEYFPILVLTANVTPEAKQSALAGGALDFLTKPIDAVEVILRVKNLLTTRAMHLQLKNQNMVLEEMVRQRTAHAEALVRTAARLNAHLSPHAVLDAVCEETHRALKVAAACITLDKSVGNSLHCASQPAVSPGTVEHCMPALRTLFDRHTHPMKPTLALADVRVMPDLPDLPGAAALDVRSVAAARMQRGAETIGLLAAFTVGQIRDFTSDDLTLLQGLADQAAQALENAGLYRELQAHAAELEVRVAERTADLEKANAQLQKMYEDDERALARERELNDLKTRFVSMVSHEFRTPLTAVLSSAELLEHYGARFSEEKRLTHLRRIQATVQRMTGLLDDVLLVSRSEAGQFAFEPIPLNFADFFQEIVEEFQLGMGAQHHLVMELTGMGEGEAPPLMDGRLLHHILRNLISNAIKYSPAGSTVQVAARRESDRVIIRVTDQGIGIPADDMTHLFEPFHRADNVGSIAGTGLGLNIARRAVELHRGTMAVESVEGQGCTFIVDLPVA